MRKLITLAAIAAISLALAADPALAQRKGKGGNRGKGRGRGGPQAQQAPGGAPAVNPEDALATQAVAVIDALMKKQIDPLYQNFDPEVKKAITADQLNALWGQLVAQFGSFKKFGGVRTGKIPNFDVRVITCVFEKATLDFQVVFNADKQIAGLFFKPAQPVAPPEIAPADIEEKQVVVGSAPWALNGTLSLPKGEAAATTVTTATMNKALLPAIVLVHGSGPEDRDETVGANKPFRDLAQGLAAKGIAVLRYEKRTKQYALACAGSDKPITVKEETIDDALAAVALLRKTPPIDPKKIFVAGHSLGGMLIPRIAQGDPAIAGFIILAGTARPLEDVILDQVSYLATLPGTPAAEAQKNIDEVKAQVSQIKALQPGAPHPAPLIMGAAPEYWLALKGYDPAEAAKAITQPLLLLHGERDYQVTQADTQRWQAALAGKPNVTFKSYPDLNHLFMTGKGKSVPTEYDTPGRVAQPVIDDIAAWVAAVK